MLRALYIYYRTKYIYIYENEVSLKDLSASDKKMHGAQVKIVHMWPCDEIRGSRIRPWDDVISHDNEITGKRGSLKNEITGKRAQLKIHQHISRAYKGS